MVDRIRTIHQILAELTILSEVPATQHGDKVHGGEPNRAPRGPKLSLADEHRQAYERAKTPGQRAAALKKAELELLHAQYTPPHVIRGTLEWQKAIADDPRPAWKVAEMFACSDRHVYRMRAMFKKSVLSGR